MHSSHAPVEMLPQADTANQRRMGWLVDSCFAGILFIAPLVMAGRYDIGRLVLLSMIWLVAACWLLQRVFWSRHRDWFWTGGEIWSGAVLCLVLLQTLPLPSSWLRFLSPQQPTLMPLWNTAEQTGIVSQDEPTNEWPTWSSLSLSIHETRSGLAMLIGYVTMYLVASQRIRDRSTIERLLKGIALAGVSMATLGLLQYFVGNGKFLWFIEHPSRDTLNACKGTFANENHFAHFLALCLGPMLWWFVTSMGTVTETRSSWLAHKPLTGSFPRSSWGLGAGLAIMLLAGLLTYSRGGIAVLFLAGGGTTAVFVMQRKISRRVAMGMGGVLILACAAIWIHGQEILVREMETLQQASLDTLDEGGSRRKIWRAVSTAIPDFAWLGSGVASHRFVYPRYFDDTADVEYSHAESGYLQVLLETGGVGFALLLSGIGWSGFWLYKTLVRQAGTSWSTLGVPIASSWLVSVVHAIADFNWYIPANMSVVVLLLAAAGRLPTLSDDATRRSRIPLSTSFWGVVGVTMLVLCGVSVRHLIGPARASLAWNEYLAISLATNGFEQQRLGPGRQRSIGIISRFDPETIERMYEQLSTAVAANPMDATANLRMASICLRKFELAQQQSDNVMSLVQIRDAAQASQFESRKAARAWVRRAVGENHVWLDRASLYAKRAVFLSPLLGQGYLLLSQLAFQDDSLDHSEMDLVKQAYAVRPFDPTIQFEQGRQLMLNGQLDEALELWKDAFRRGRFVRQRIVAALAPQLGPEELLALFQPDISGLRELFDYYREQEQPQALTTIGGLYVAEVEKQARLVSGEAAGLLWFDAQHAHAVLGNAEQAAEAATAGVRAVPTSFKFRYTRALRLREAGRATEAMRELRWCQARRPDQEGLQNLMVAVEREARYERAEANLIESTQR